MKVTEFRTRFTNKTINGLFEVVDGENTNMYDLSIKENWNLEKVENPIFDSILQKYFEVTTGNFFNFSATIMKDSDNNLLIKNQDKLFYLHISDIVESINLSLCDVIYY